MSGHIVEVIIPWRGGCPHRERALEWVLGRYADRHPAWQVVLAEAIGDGPWVKAIAICRAAEQSAADVVVVADADVWCDGTARAVDAVVDGSPWAVPHGRVMRLNETGTASVLAGAFPDGAQLAEPPYRGHAGGGITVLTRWAFDAAPPDPRFVGWGQEDDAWATALVTLTGRPWRGTDLLWHLWHPPQARTNRRHGSAANVALLHRYGRARRDRAAMAALVDEGRQAWRSSVSS